METIILEQDGCRVNAETEVGRFPVEPLNAVSNIVFLFLLIYWARKVGFRYSRYPLIVIVLPLMFLGLITATIHHSFRIDKAWKTVTVLTVFQSVVMACVYFWYRISAKWSYAFFLTLVFPLVFWLFYLNNNGIAEKMNLSVIYVAMSIAILIPALIFCFKNKLRNIELLAISSLLFSFGMVFRVIDIRSKDFFIHGTHFLWHLFGAAAVFVLLRFIYFADEQRAEQLTRNAISRRKKER